MSVFDSFLTSIKGEEQAQEFQDPVQDRSAVVNEIDQIQRQLLQLKGTL